MSDLVTHSIHCSGCGAPLDVASNRNGRIICEYCGTANVVEKFTQNMAVLTKQNIESGFELSATKARLHKHVLDVLLKPEDAPLDILDKVEIIKEEHICLPVYAFHVNGMGTFSYEVGLQRERSEVYTVNGEARTRTVAYTEWYPNSSATSCSDVFFAPGTKEYAEIFDQFSQKLSTSDLVDIEELSFPADVQCLEYNYSQISSFEEFVKPKVENLLRAKAESTLSGKNWRNGLMQGSQISKDEMTRLYMQFYRIVYIYGNKNYSLYVMNDGSYAIYEELITDPERTADLAAKREAVKEVKPKSKALYNFAMIASIITGVVVMGLLSNINAETVGVIFLLIFVVGGIIFRSIFSKKINKDYAARKAVEEEKLTAALKEFENIKNRFLSEKKALKGIYESLSGNPEAF